MPSILCNLSKLFQVLRQSCGKLHQMEKGSRKSHRSVHEEIDVTRRLEIYRREIRECREEYSAEVRRDRDLLFNILKLWKSIKHLRRSKKCTNCTVKLVIKKEEVNKEEEEEKRKEELEEEVREVLEEHEEEYASKMRSYEEELREWKTAHKKRV